MSALTATHTATRAPQRTRGAARADYLADLEAAGRAGLAAQALADKYDIQRYTVIALLGLMRRDGQAVSVWTGGNTPARYYATQYAPPARAADKHSIVTNNKHSARLDPDAPAINHGQVQVQICPAGRDHRFTADPLIAGRGVISSDWRERRLQEAQR